MRLFPSLIESIVMTYADFTRRMTPGRKRIYFWVYLMLVIVSLPPFFLAHVFHAFTELFKFVLEQIQNLNFWVIKKMSNKEFKRW